MKEEWKDINGFEGLYQVSNHGRVKSLKRVIKRKNRGEFSDSYPVKEKILKPYVNSIGYETVTLHDKNGHSPFLIHRLVAEVFIPNKQNKPQVNHKDCDKTNNYFKNLEWCTIPENLKHASENNLIARGERVGTAKLSEEAVLSIRNHADNNGRYYGRAELADEHGVSEATIKKIVNRQLWRHV